MKAVLIDASSAILLYKAGLFDAVAAAYRLMMTPAVYQEVTVAGRNGADRFEAFCRSRRIEVTAKPERNDLDDGLSSLGSGERETLLVYAVGGADFVILDDRKGVACCRSRGIPHINALLCPKILRWSGRLDRDAYTRAFAHLLDQGRYGSHVVEFAIECHRSRMCDFLP